MKSLLPSFAGDIVGNISEDIDDILEAVGEGLEEFFSSMEDIDPRGSADITTDRFKCIANANCTGFG